MWVRCPLAHLAPKFLGVIFMPKIKVNNKEKENKQMAVIIKLNGVTIGEATMTTSEIRNAENAGFTILRNGKRR